MALLCLVIGLLFVAVSAVTPGLVFITAGGIAEVLCLLLGRTRCHNAVREGRKVAI
jgi:hypothetical protein